MSFEVAVSWVNGEEGQSPEVKKTREYFQELKESGVQV